jgi:hypothetical protein
MKLLSQLAAELIFGFLAIAAAAHLLSSAMEVIH